MPLSPQLYAAVSGSLNGKSILSPDQHESICVTVLFLLKHSYVLQSWGCLSAVTQHAEANPVLNPFFDTNRGRILDREAISLRRLKFNAVKFYSSVLDLNIYIYHVSPHFWDG